MPGFLCIWKNWPSFLQILINVTRMPPKHTGSLPLSQKSTLLASNVTLDDYRRPSWQLTTHCNINNLRRFNWTCSLSSAGQPWHSCDINKCFRLIPLPLNWSGEIVKHSEDYQVDMLKRQKDKNKQKEKIQHRQTSLTLNSSGKRKAFRTMWKPSHFWPSNQLLCAVGTFHKLSLGFDNSFE